MQSIAINYMLHKFFYKKQSPTCFFREFINIIAIKIEVTRIKQTKYKKRTLVKYLG